jgi:CubicO group peptidase (beta-lactamase class C family)
MVIPMSTARYPGGVVGTSHRGTRRIEPFGEVLDAGGRRPARADDRFLLTSITKLLTATQVHLLVQDGRLALTDPVAQHVPEFAAADKAGVTVAHLLTHTSGIDPTANTAERADAAAVAEPHVRAALAAALTSAPGERFAYSSPGFWVLGMLISALAGEPYDRNLERLGLPDLRYEIGVAEPERYVHRDAPGAMHRHEAARTAGYPAGGVVAAAADLLAFGEAMAADLAPVAAGLRSTAVDGVWQDVPVRWGMGCELGGPARAWPRDTLFASGASGTALWIHPESKRVAVLLTAGWDADRAGLAEVGDRALSH